MSGGVSCSDQEFTGIVTNGNSRIVGGGKGGYRFKAVAVQCHLDKIFGGQCDAAGPLGQFEREVADSLISPVHHLGANQPFGVREITIEIVRLALVEQSAGKSLCDMGRRDSGSVTRQSNWC